MLRGFYKNLLHLRSLLSTKVMVSSGDPFVLTSYDAVGLDFDNTLVLYNITNLFQYHYTYLTNFLVTEKGYQGLSTKMNQGDIDFIRRGLFMDFKRGNILEISSEGIIMSASHGTKKLDLQDIRTIYGEELKWSATELFIKDILALWEKPACDETRTFLDYSDITGTLVFAKAIDFIDESNNDDYSKVWPDLLDAIIDMYRPDSDFSKALLCDMPSYIHRCEQNVIDFLNKLKQRCKLFLITGSSPAIVKPMAAYAIGNDWENLFHSVVYNAKKPGFFTCNAKFMTENEVVIDKLCTSQGHYMRGSWMELYEKLTQEMQRTPKCVYFGDSTIQDIYAPSLARKPIDCVSVIEETLADGEFPGEHPHSNYLRSQFWGPYFGKDNQRTIMGDLIMNYSKLCIPSLSYLTERSLDHNYTPFWK